ncbi:MAG: hypothetical protein RLZZ623_3471 [Actinomycetota bacterium]|jgi:hypothetical protein
MQPLIAPEPVAPPQPVSAVARAVEALITALVAATLAWLVGGLIHPAVGAVLAAVGAVNGALSGWRSVYGWRRHGVLALVLDSTWASLPVAVSLGAHVVAAVSADAGYEASLSVRQNRHVYRRGAHLKPGFAFTIGNVISSAGDVDRPRRRRLITDHEDVHVWQARWFGPFYLLLYGGWSVLGTVGGVLLWLKRGRSGPLSVMVESCSYYLNPFEWWAYSRDALWPPPGKVHGIGWSKPAARPLSTLRRRQPKP